MNAHKTLTTVRPPATVAMILGTSFARPATTPKRASEAPRPTHSAAPAPQNDLVTFREDIGRRYAMPVPASKPNGAINAAAGLQPQPPPGYQILVVDDEPSVCRAIKLLLKFDGHAVHTVASGEAALALFEPGKFDLVITDYSMWGMKGDELAARIKQRQPDQPIILATASAAGFNSSDKPFGDVDCVLIKPFSLIELRKAMVQVLP